jgi:hypothetical protein
MSVRLVTKEEFDEQLTSRNCRFIKKSAAGGFIWEDPQGEPFYVPEPEEISSGVYVYPDWQMWDLIDEVGLGPSGPACH